MSPTYLVGFSDSPFEDQEFGIVNAPDSDEALLLFIQVFGLQSDEFIEYVYDKSVDGSLSEHFWAQTDKEEMRVHAGTRIAANSGGAEQTLNRIGAPVPQVTRILPESDRRMSASPHSNSVCEAAQKSGSMAEHA